MRRPTWQVQTHLSPTRRSPLEFSKTVNVQPLYLTQCTSCALYSEARFISHLFGMISCCEVAHDYLLKADSQRAPFYIEVEHAAELLQQLHQHLSVNRFRSRLRKLCASAVHFPTPNQLGRVQHDQRLRSQHLLTSPRISSFAKNLNRLAHNSRSLSSLHVA